MAGRSPGDSIRKFIENSIGESCQTGSEGDSLQSRQTLGFDGSGMAIVLPQHLQILGLICPGCILNGLWSAGQCGCSTHRACSESAPSSGGGGHG